MGGERRALRVLRIAGTVVVILSVMLLLTAPAAPVRANVPGFVNPVVGFELASEPAHVFDIVGAPGDPARDDTVRRMDRTNEIDFLYMIAYPALYVGIAMLLAARGLIGSGTAGFIMLLAGLMWLGDLLENRQLLALTATTDPEAMRAPLARLRPFTLMKWHALFGASLLVAVFLWAERTWWRWSALAFGAAGIIGFASLVHLPAIEWSSYCLALAWLLTYVYAMRARPERA